MPLVGIHHSLSQGIRPAEQRNIDEYVPGRLPYLKKWIKDSEVAEKGTSFEPRPSTKAICQRCQTQIPYSANPKELMKHMEKCWAPGLEPPVGESDGREHRPNLLGEVAAEVDTTCQLFTIHSPGPYGGTYLLLVALPSQEGTLEKLDNLLRKVWFPDVDHNFSRPDLKHLSMFMMSQASGMDRTQLKMELQRLQLSVRGSDDDLRGRLEEHWFRRGGAKKGVQGDHWASVVQVNEVKSSGDEGKMEVEESVSLEDRLYSDFLPNCGALEVAGMAPGVSAGLLTAGRVITVRYICLSNVMPSSFNVVVAGSGRRKAQRCGGRQCAFLRLQPGCWARWMGREAGTADTRRAPSGTVSSSTEATRGSGSGQIIRT